MTYGETMARAQRVEADLKLLQRQFSPSEEDAEYQARLKEELETLEASLRISRGF